MSVVLHMSDPHFGTEVASVERALLALHGELAPDLVIVSGDLTQRARRGQFERAQRFFERLTPRKLLVLPGNHDLPLYRAWERVWGPYAGYCRTFGPQLEPRFESDDVLVLGVNTTRASRIEDGEISESQIRRVADELSRSSSRQLKLVVTHHPVHIVASHDKKNLVHNASNAVHAWTAAGADLFLGGHIHLPYVRPLSERYVDLAGPSWIVQAGTALSSRIRESIPNSVNVIRFQPEHDAAGPTPAATDASASSNDVPAPRGCLVERWDFDVSTTRFSMVEQGSLALAGW